MRGKDRFSIFSFSDYDQWTNTGGAMSTKFYFHGLEVRNFRTFDHLLVDRFKRINIIGGLNGVGKSALLETLFLFLDRQNSLALVRPLQWRRLEISGPIDPKQFFQDPTQTTAEITYKHLNGSHKIKLNYQPIPPNISVSIQNTAQANGIATTAPNTNGMSLKVLDSQGNEQEETFLAPAQGGAIGNTGKVSDTHIPPGVLLSTNNRGAPQEISSRLSTIIRQRRLPDLLTALKLLVPDLVNVMTLQDGALPQVYADVAGNLMPIQLMGDGFQNLFQCLIGIMNSQNGVLLLDEIDAAMHYSKISVVWSIIARMASAENCQIFATTHSRECINSAADGIKKAGLSADFQYFRLEKGESGHVAIPYDMDEVHEAELSNIEIR